MNAKILSSVLCLLLILSSCGSYKKMGYLKNVETLTPEQLSTVKENTARIKPGDLLTIYVNAIDPMGVISFNLPIMPMQTDGSVVTTSTLGIQSYIVDTNGDIEFPVLGKLHIRGKTRNEVEEMIKSQIYPKHVTQEPIVTVRYVNYRVSVMGEVNRPGVYTFPTENVNIMEALAMAGDLTIFGKRDNILLIREDVDGSKQYVRLNLQDKNLALSPYFYMQQNDILYIEPNKARGNSASIGATENLTISIVSTLISVVTLLVTVFK